MPSSRVLRMVSACDEPWSAMRAAPAGRHCARCDKVVVDLTRVTAARAAAIGLVFGRGGLCARIR
ncbi:MAG TPA: hypothetical protein VL400_05340, partial [Polyangiaceae bacterium]|nr:hypothetical protein [Polyangiaceae bacterium]